MADVIVGFDKETISVDDNTRAKILVLQQILRVLEMK